MTALLEADLLSPALVLPAGAEFGGPLLRPVRAAGAAPRAAVVLATLRASSASAASLGAPVLLVGSGVLGAGVAVTRAHTPGGATSAVRGLMAWQEIAANQPRFDGPAQRLRVTPAATNLIAAARTVGLTGWTTGAMASAVASTGPDGGAATGTLLTEDTATASHRVLSASVSVTNGVTYSFGVMAAAGTADLIQVAVSLTRFSGSVFVNVRLSGEGTIERVGADAINAAVVQIGGWYWITFDAVCISSGTAQVLPTLIISPTATRGLSHLGTGRTIRMAWANMIAGVRGGLPLLPAAGAPASVTRAADVPIWTPSTMPARGAILLRGSLDALAGASALGLLQLDDGTDANRIVAQIIAGGGQPEALVVSGGVTTATLTPVGALAAGGEFRALLAWSPGGVRFGTSAGGIVSASAARPAGLTRGVLGQANAAGTLPLGGEILADLYDYWPSEAEALAILAA